MSHLSPLALQNILQYFIKISDILLKIQDKIETTNWSRVSKVYEGFQYSIIRHFGIIQQEINNLYTLFCMQSGKISKDRCRISGKLVKMLENKEITLISLEHAVGIIEPYIRVYYDMLIKAVPMNFDTLEEEKEKVLSDLSDISESEGSFSRKSVESNEINSK